MSPYYRNAILLWLALVAIGATTLFDLTNWHWLLIVLVSANISTFIVMGYDKMQASMRGARTPEVVFYLMTLLGGSVGMLAGMYIFHHKTRKASFQFFVGLMILLQIFTIIYLEPDIVTTISF